jgi:hypothetical protein
LVKQPVAFACGVMADGGEMNNVDEVPDDAYFHEDFLPWHRTVVGYSTAEGDDDEEEEVVDDRCLATCPKWQARVLRAVWALAANYPHGP